MQRSAWIFRQVTRSRSRSRSSSFAFCCSYFSSPSSSRCISSKLYHCLVATERYASTDAAAGDLFVSSHPNKKQREASNTFNTETKSLSSEARKSEDVHSLRLALYKHIKTNEDDEEIERLILNVIALCGSREDLQRATVAYFAEIIAKARTDPTARIPKRRQKMLSRLNRLISRLLKAFDLPLATVQNLHRTACENSVKLFCYRRFLKNAMSDANFGDLIQGVLEVDPTMRRFVVDYLGDMEDPAAFQWARRFQEPSYCAASNSSLEAEPQFRPFSSETFALPERIRQSISMVDTKNGLNNCLNQVFASTSSEELVIGLDTEFMPGFLTLDEQVALLQIATKERIFLIDLYTLENQLDNQDWIDFFRQLLCNNRAIKIGFEFLSDLRILNATLPFCRDVMSKTTNVVCLAKLIHNFCQADASFYYALHMSKTSEETVANNPADVGELPPLGFGLSDLCAFLLGQPLDKSWQLSHWTKRPLRAEQMDYAALDAYCLVEIFDELKKKAKELSIDWEDIVVRSTINLNFTKKKRVIRNKLQ